MKLSARIISISAIALALSLAGCATTTSTVIETPKVNSYQSDYTGTKSKLAVGQFVNRSSFQNGIFSNGIDRLGSQAKTSIMSHLQQTNRFTVLDRDNMSMLKSEAQLAGTTQTLSGARYIITLVMSLSLGVKISVTNSFLGF